MRKLRTSSGFSRRGWQFVIQRVRSASDELESDLLTNQMRHFDFELLLGYPSELIARDETKPAWQEAASTSLS